MICGSVMSAVVLSVLTAWPAAGQNGGWSTQDEAGVRAAVEAAARDYMEGSYSGTPERMERALHPELHKVRLVTHPETGVQFLQKMGYSALVEGTRAGMGMLPEGEWGVEVEIFDVSHDMAGSGWASAPAEAADVGR